MDKEQNTSSTPTNPSTIPNSPILDNTHNFINNTNITYKLK